GPQSTLELCVTRDIESTLNACDPTFAPPAAIIALRWGSDADVDLVVKTPSGKLIDAAHPASELGEDGTVDADAPGVGVLQIDSTPSCELDGYGIETIQFNHSPERGTYQVYANLFEACGRLSVAVEASAYGRALLEAGRDGEPDRFEIVQLGDSAHAVLLGP